MTKNILVLGATGYIGSRLVPELIKNDYNVKIAYRTPEKILNKYWIKSRNVIPIKVDVFDLESLNEAMKEIDVVYYLVHSMNPSVKDFSSADNQAAQNVAETAELNGVKRIIYLGGLGDESKKLSKHLQSRLDVGKILKNGSVPVTIFNAAIIIGSGSVAFEIMRYLVDRLPIMITPRWLRTKNQPIAISNCVYYLVRSLEIEETIDNTYDIGGPEIISYRDLMDTYASLKGLGKRVIIPIPFFSPSLSSHWIRFITGIDSSIARPLIDGMKTEVVCKDDKIRELMPQRLLTVKEAIKNSLSLEPYINNNKLMNVHKIDHAWNHPGDPAYTGGLMYKNRYEILVNERKEKIWKLIMKASENHSYIYPDWMLKIGINFKKFFSKNENDRLWYVMKKEPSIFLSSVSKFGPMGSGILSFDIKEINTNETKLHMTAKFIPIGIWGLLYWKILDSFHFFVFPSMIKRLFKFSNLEMKTNPKRVY